MGGRKGGVAGPSEAVRAHDKDHVGGGHGVAETAHLKGALPAERVVDPMANHIEGAEAMPAIDRSELLVSAEPAPVSRISQGALGALGDPVGDVRLTVGKPSVLVASRAAERTDAPAPAQPSPTAAFAPIQAPPIRPREQAQALAANVIESTNRANAIERARAEPGSRRVEIADTTPAVEAGLADYYQYEAANQADGKPFLTSFQREDAYEINVKHYVDYKRALMASPPSTVEVAPTDPSTIVRPPHYEKGKNSDLYWYNRPGGTQIGLKPYSGENQGTGLKDLATSKIQDIAGWHVAARAKNGIVNGVLGVVFEVFSAEFEMVRAINAVAIANNPAYAVSLARVRILDYLTGAADRNVANIRFAPPNELRVLDHWESFGARLIPIREERCPLTGGILPETYPPIVIEEFRHFTPAKLREATVDLDPAQREAVIARYYIVRADIMAKHPN